MTLRFNALEQRESMIEMGSLSVITKVSRVFARIYAYTARWKGSKSPGPIPTWGSSAMKYFSAYFWGILILTAARSSAQTSGAVRVYTIPAGRTFSVDGVFYSAPLSAMWQSGTKHILSTDKGQDQGNAKTV